MGYCVECELYGGETHGILADSDLVIRPLVPVIERDYEVVYEKEGDGTPK
jgi:hypothetical protein